jgi:hypothetical protein
MTSDALTRLVNRPDQHPGANGYVDSTPAPDLAAEVAQLRNALVSNRRIGMAMGILMRDRDVDEQEAFAVLRRISQNSNRKLRDVAEDVICCVPRQTRGEPKASGPQPADPRQVVTGRSPV